MKHFLSILIICWTFTGFSQFSIDGTWKGILFTEGQAYSSGSVLWLKLTASGEKIDGSTRNEVFDTDFYALKKVRGSNKGGQIHLEEFVTTKKKATTTFNFCRLKFDLHYNEITGYLEGTYTSSDCRHFTGKVILIKTHDNFSETDTPSLTHAWAKMLIDDLMKGKKAPHIRELERKNFKFTPIYFDYDEAEIRPEYHEYLKKMAAIVLDHSDLRIQVTGHTDGDGSDAYNMSLSERRAKAIKEFFVNQGLREDRVRIDFKGKRSPVAPNSTREGMQLNRRVDFAFI